ncbi:hypothetical protein F4560_003269 [Saccharothrix ecbatanensis]|uniref:Uncharacterized protein n=2 Tax=Saccharothrix ecbatanensis TaxID=1105145 RepID=A0A7W9M139_9PSEU|nr:hypothetical protein [Saccharothrix ecbatanensis]
MVFTDTDGSAYLYFGGARQPRVVRLDSDMVSTAGSITDVVLDGSTRFAEAPHIRKVGDTCYERDFACPRYVDA